MENREIAEILETIGQILEIQGENPFKVRAYHNAGRMVAGLATPVSQIVGEGKLQDLPGIGPALQEKITQLIQTGQMEYYSELRSSIPAGLLEILRIPSVGPKKVKALWQELGIKSLRELEEACHGSKLVALKGFGKKTQDKILDGIRFIARHANQFRLGDAMPVAWKFLEWMGQTSVDRCSLAGSIRRCKEVVRDIDILASSDDPAQVMEHFLKFGGIESVLGHGETKSSIRLRSGLQVDLRVVHDPEFACALAYFTGSKEHNVLLRSRALKLGMKVNEYGIWKDARSLSCSGEEQFYEHLGLKFVPPELREGQDEVDKAEHGALPNLIDAPDLKGVFHSHTTWSDGTATLVQMAEKARSMGLEYMGLSDHSKAAAYANGMDETRLRSQMKEVDALNSCIEGFRILKGLECDILPDGSLDLNEQVLGELDFVIGSIHSRFDMSEEEMTRRVCKALSNKHLDFLGHPTGRLLLDREGFKIDLGQVIEVARKHGKVLEINANPHRLDLDSTWARRAKEAGVLLSINPDAHSTQGLEDIRYGLGTARRAGLEKPDVLNSRSLEEVLRILK